MSIYAYIGAGITCARHYFWKIRLELTGPIHLKITDDRV